MKSLYGVSTLLHWQRPEGPDVFAYAYPGMWTGAGMNSEGIALCWTSGNSEGVSGPRVGIPSYVLIAQILYQPTLEEVVEEVRRARHAGLFTFVLGDANGRLVNVEGSPSGELAVEWHEGHFARVGFGSRLMTKTPEGQPIPYVKRCRRLLDLAAANRGQIDVPKIKGYFDLGQGVCNSGTIDAMIFDCAHREVHLTRADGTAARAWTRYPFGASG
jgi:hypothetical protein